MTTLAIVTLAAFALLCAATCAVAACLAAFFDMIRVVNQADAKRPPELVWRQGLAAHVRTLPRDRGRFTRQARP
jgi:hypothetical protein